MFQLTDLSVDLNIFKEIREFEGEITSEEFLKIWDATITERHELFKITSLSAILKTFSCFNVENGYELVLKIFMYA